ncbi:MAG: hypothetical protein H6601_04485 [Flavobacteriales bacterium]|nr:hypothetical protein [Flavobacteriales bacterium]
MRQKLYLSKAIILLEHVGFLVLGILAVLLANERLIADSGYYFIQVVNSEWFWIEHNRLILALSQIAVLLGTWAGIGMKGLIIVYSIWHVLFFYLIYLVSKFKYRNGAAGLILLLIQTLGMGFGFFVPMFELYYAAGLIILFDSILSEGQIKLPQTLLLGILSIFIASAHFFAVALLGMVIIVHGIESRFKHLRSYVVPILAIIAVLIFKKFNISEYEQGKIDWFINGLHNFTFSAEYLNNLSSFLSAHYVDFLLIMALNLALIVYSRKWMILAVFIGSVVILTVMVTISDPWFQASRYQEQVYFPLMFLAAYFLVKYGFASNHNWLKHGAVALVSVTFLIRIIGIQEKSEWFTGRLNELRGHIQLAQELEGTKFIVNEAKLEFEPNWSYPIESLIISASEFEKTVTICTDADISYDDNRTKLLPNQFLFRRWEVHELSELNPAYFELDSSEYQLIPTGN